MGTAFLADVTLTTISCKCGGTYAISEVYRQKKHDVGGSWHCPYCQTGWGYSGKSRVQQLEEELARERAQSDQAKAYLRDQRDRQEKRATDAEHRERSQKAAKTRIKNRIAKGVCPCCNRSFGIGELQRHLETKHPDFTVAE